MKNIIVLCVLFFTALTVQAQTDQFTLRVEGLGCPFCAYGLEKKFKDVKGIKNVKIDIQTGKMTFNVPAANGLKLTDADARVSKAGYTAKGISVVRSTGKTENMGDDNTAVAPTAMGNTKQMVKVSGNCEMCKARIDKAAKSVKALVWQIGTSIAKCWPSNLTTKRQIWPRFKPLSPKWVTILRGLNRTLKRMMDCLLVANIGSKCGVLGLNNSNFCF